jgi:hypothetical protein
MDADGGSSGFGCEQPVRYEHSRPGELVHIDFSVRCARKWVVRFRPEGESGLHDRSSAPRQVANRTPDERVR